MNLKRLEAVQGGREVRQSEGEGEGGRENGSSVCSDVLGEGDVVMTTMTVTTRMMMMSVGMW